MIINDLYFSDKKDEILAYGGQGGDILIPEGVKSISSNSFTAASVKEIVFPESLECIGKDAFYMCKQIKNIYIPNKVKLDKETFGLTSKLEKLDINCEIIPTSCFTTSGTNSPKGMEITLRNTKIIESSAFSESFINRINFPDTLKEIEEDAFLDAKFNKTALVLPENLKILKQGAFRGTNITDIYISDNIEFIAYQDNNILIHLSQKAYDKLNYLYPIPLFFDDKCFVIEDGIDELLGKLTFKELNKKYLEKEHMISDLDKNTLLEQDK